MNVITNSSVFTDTARIAAYASIVAACVAGIFKVVEILGIALKEWLSELRVRERALWDYFEHQLQDFYGNAGLMRIMHDLRQERIHPGYSSDLDGDALRELPSVLEKVGIFIYTRRGTTRGSYRPFSEAVLLCDGSKMMWPDGEREKAYWIAFNRFAEDTKRQGYRLSDSGKLMFNPFKQVS